jgi:uncharacterized protein YkwD
MRRKPVVVVGMAAVLLVAGGIAATRAGAEETPEWPAVPGFSFADLPGFPGFGDDSSGDDGDAGNGGADVGNGSGDVGNGSGDVGDASGDVSGGDVDGSGGDVDVSGDDSGVGTDTDEPVPGDRDRSDSGNDDDSAAGVRSDTEPGGAVHDVPEMPAPQKAAGVPARPRPALVRQDAGGGLIAAARQDVTARDISESPNAPVQQEILTLINGNRRQHGCGSVTLDRRLIVAANGHAADMARNDYFAHESPNGQGAGDRVTDAGYNWRHYGENIARGVDSAFEVVDGWMHSPEHRHNILDCSLDQMGVGIAIAGDAKNTVYWVQDFATPM